MRVHPSVCKPHYVIPRACLPHQLSFIAVTVLWPVYETGRGGGGGSEDVELLKAQCVDFFLVNIFIQDDMDTCTQHGPVTGVKVGPECFK